MPPKIPPEMFPEHFWSRVAKSDGCWLWTGSLTKHEGYGHLQAQGRFTSAHRLAWTLTYGPIPDGRWVLHHCDNPPCVRPEHLFLGTPQDNQTDRMLKGRGRRTHCRRGHELTGRNVIMRNGIRRGCAACSVVRHRELRHSRKAWADAHPL